METLEWLSQMHVKQWRLMLYEKLFSLIPFKAIVLPLYRRYFQRPKPKATALERVIEIQEESEMPEADANLSPSTLMANIKDQSLVKPDLLSTEPYFQNETFDLSPSRQLLSASSPELLRHPLLDSGNGGYLEDEDDAFKPA